MARLTGAVGGPWPLPALWVTDFGDFPDVWFQGSLLREPTLQELEEIRWERHEEPGVMRRQRVKG